MIHGNDKENPSFLQLFFANKGLNTIHFCNSHWCCMFFFDVRIQITPLISSSSSYTINLLELWLHLFFKDQPVPIISYSYTTPISLILLNIDVSCRTSVLMTQKLILLIVLAKILISNIVQLATPLRTDATVHPRIFVRFGLLKLWFSV